MDAETVNQLLEINRAFYSQFSADFSASRSSERLNIEPFRKYLTNDIRMLDAGCGNGRLAGTLEQAGFSLDYVGVDGSPELVGFAEQKCAGLKNVRAQFRVVELTMRDWSETVSDVAPFDMIVSLAVLHHIPSFDLRAQVLREIRSVLKPRGMFVMSNWQFINNERLRKKIVEWERLEIGDWRLETGDYLLNWKRGGVGYRYVHFVDESEVAQLASQSGFRVVEQFYADANLNLYSILQSLISNLYY